MLPGISRITIAVWETHRREARTVRHLRAQARAVLISKGIRYEYYFIS
jgi:hypothetical protein